MKEEGINIMSYPSYSPSLILWNFRLTNSVERSLTDLAHAVSKAPNNFFKKDFKKTFKKLLERFDKIKLKISLHLYIFILCCTNFWLDLSKTLLFP